MGFGLGGSQLVKQAVLRALYLTEMPFLQSYHLNVRRKVPDCVREVESRFQQSCAAVLTSIPDYLEKQVADGKCESQLLPDLAKLLSSASAEENPIFSSDEETLLGLSRKIASLFDPLNEDFYSAPLFTTARGPSDARLD